MYIIIPEKLIKQLMLGTSTKTMIPQNFAGPKKLRHHCLLWVCWGSIRYVFGRILVSIPQMLTPEQLDGSLKLWLSNKWMMKTSGKWRCLSESPTENVINPGGDWNLWVGGRSKWSWTNFKFARWWQLKYFLFSSRSLGKMNPFWRAYFSKGLKPPTSYDHWKHPRSVVSFLLKIFTGRNP